MHDAHTINYPSHAGRYCTTFFILCLLSQGLCGAYQSDRGQTGDEAAHFVTSLMIFDYISAHIGENPLIFAKSYYIHFPRVAFGHWPPMFEFTQATLFFFGRNSTIALVFQAAVWGLFAGLPATIVGRRHGALAGCLTGAITFASPYALFLTNTVMADNLLTVMVVISAMAWEKFYRCQNWIWCIAFGASAAGAILTKGSAFGLAFMPILFLILERDLSALFRPKVVLSAVIVAVLTIPWYAATYKYASDGFNYSFGWEFSRIAIPRYGLGLLATVGISVTIAYCFGLYKAVAEYRSSNNVYIALSVSMIIFACIAPADITNRYLIPAIPAIIIVSICTVCSLIPLSDGEVNIPVPRTLLLISFSIISIFGVFSKPHVEPFNAVNVVKSLDTQQHRNTLVLVSGGPNFEGSIIAAFAEKERIPYHYIIRSSKVLASSDFMGTDYKSRFKDQSNMRAWITKNQIGWVVVSDDSSSLLYAHNRMLADLMAGSDSFKQIASFDGPRGKVTVYLLPDADAVPNLTWPIFSEIGIDKRF